MKLGYDELSSSYAYVGGNFTEQHTNIQKR